MHPHGSAHAMVRAADNGLDGPIPNITTYRLGGGARDAQDLIVVLGLHGQPHAAPAAARTAAPLRLLRPWHVHVLLWPADVAGTAGQRGATHGHEGRHESTTRIPATSAAARGSAHKLILRRQEGGHTDQGDP